MKYLHPERNVSMTLAYDVTMSSINRIIDTCLGESILIRFVLRHYSCCVRLNDVLSAPSESYAPLMCRIVNQ